MIDSTVQQCVQCTLKKISLFTFNVVYKQNVKARKSVIILSFIFTYRCNSFIVDLRHKFTIRNMNEIPVFVQSSELNNIT